MGIVTKAIILTLLVGILCLLRGIFKSGLDVKNEHSNHEEKLQKTPTPNGHVSTSKNENVPLKDSNK